MILGFIQGLILWPPFHIQTANLGPFLGRRISLVADPGNSDKTTRVGCKRVFRTTAIISSPAFLTQETQAADLSAGLVPIYSQIDRRPGGARYFKLREEL